jgi:ribosomal protein S18 acetylase RimI-like enzyme
MVIRKLKAAESDLTFQRLMLIEAAYWRSVDDRPSIDDALSDPELSKLVADWGRKGDTGFVAENEDVLLGAVWYRYWTDEDHSYGYVASDIPELAIGVSPAHRGKGIGATLIQSLLSHGLKSGVRQISLSVEKDNPAARLYERQGFKVVGHVENAWTMVVDLG